jgi:site-specific recombinase XerD
MVDQPAAVDRLPGRSNQDPYERLATAFLLGYTTNSAKGYAGDLRAWWSWCLRCGVHPFDARRHHVDAWVRAMQLPASSSAMLEHDEPTETPKSPMKPASIRRRLSAVSKLYKYGIECEVLTYSPVEHVQRPKASDETDSIGLSPAEVQALIDAAAARSLLHCALVTLLAYNGLRIDEALGADVSDYTHSGGHRVLRITRKGGTRATVPIAPPTARALDEYLASRPQPPQGPLFTSQRNTSARLPYRTAYGMVGQLARAAVLPAADQVTPHTMRHTFITEALAAGAPLQDVQDAAGHKDPQTTRRYDRNRLSHDRHPTYAFAAHLARNGHSTRSDETLS